MFSNKNVRFKNPELY